MNKLIISTLKLGLSAVLIAGSANAATITQATNGASGTNWNNATVWNGTAPTAGNVILNGGLWAAGTYSATQLNGQFGNGSQFTGSESLTVIPEPGTYALIGGLLALGLVVSRRARRTA